LISESEIFRPLSADLFQKIEADEKAVGKEIEKKKEGNLRSLFHSAERQSARRAASSASS